MSASGSHAFVASAGVRAFDLSVCLGQIFSDDFESGDWSRWSATSP